MNNNDSMRTSHSPGREIMTLAKPRQLTGAANRLAAIAAVIGLASGGAASLTATWPTTALWMSRIVCGGPNQLMIDTSHYSSRPGQSGTSVDFQCLTVDGAHEASWFAIDFLQTVWVAAVVCGALSVGVLIRRTLKRQPNSRLRVLTTGGLTLLAAFAVAVSALALGSPVPVQMAPGSSMTIDGNGETKMIACNGGQLTIDGRDETVTATGHCGHIVVDAVSSHITVDSVDAVDVDGIQNVVTYHSGSPQITDTGMSDIVQQGLKGQGG